MVNSGSFAVADVNPIRRTTTLKKNHFERFELLLYLAASQERCESVRIVKGTLMLRGLFALIVLIWLSESLLAQGSFSGYEAFKRGDYAAARRIWEPLAEAGDRTAQYNLGIMYHRGLGSAPDMAKAAKWYMRAANAGHAKAQETIGDFYSIGVLSGGDDDASAATWYRRAAERGLASAQRKFGILLATGHGVKQDRKEAMKWLRRAQRKGDKNAETWIASLEKPDADAASNREHPQAQLKAAVTAYRQGRHAEALAVLEELAGQYLPEAEHWLEVVRNNGPSNLTDPLAKISGACVAYLIAQSRADDIETECAEVRSDACVNYLVSEDRGYDIREQCGGVRSDACVELLVSRGRGYDIATECKGEINEACLRYFAADNRGYDATLACKGVRSDKCVRHLISRNKAYEIPTRCGSVESEACVTYLVSQNRGHEIESVCADIKSDLCVEYLRARGKAYDIESDCRKVASDACVKLIIEKDQWENVQAYCAI